MKKSAKIYIVVLVWTAALIQLFVNEEVNIQAEILTTFVNTDVMNSETIICVWGEYGDAVYDKGTIRNILGNAAIEFGVTDSYIISSGNKNFTTDSMLQGQGTYGNTSLQFVTDDTNEKSYLITEIKLQGTDTDGNECRRMLEDFYESIGVICNKSVSIWGSQNGSMNKEEMDAFSNKILAEINGKWVSGNFLSANTDGVSENLPVTYVIYGFTKDLEGNTYLDDKKVNICITFCYHPETGTTEINVKFPY